jgi:hypothetical protein
MSASHSKHPDRQPDAYDPQGRPLYYLDESLAPQHTPKTPVVVPVHQPVAPTNTPRAKQQPSSEHKLTPAEQADHARSVHDYPDLDLSDDEYVVIDVERHGIAYFYIWFVAVSVAAIFMVGPYFIASLETSMFKINSGMLLLAGFAAAALALLCGAIAQWVLKQNYLIVSNQRVFVRYQGTPFAHRTQVIEMENIEDISHSQHTILQMVFGYGTIRLSTVGEENTYMFPYARDPAAQMKVINRVVQDVDEGEATRYRSRPAK